MNSDVVIETERLRLRKFVVEDAPALFQVGSDPRVQEFTGDPCLASVEEARQVLLKHPIEDYRLHGFGRWAMILKQTDKLIGMAGLKYLPEFGEVDIGYRLLPELWGNGLATEASLAAIQYGFLNLRLTRIWALVNPLNVRSVRVLEKCELAFEKMRQIDSHNVAQFAIYQTIHSPIHPSC